MRLVEKGNIVAGGAQGLRQRGPLEAGLAAKVIADGGHVHLRGLRDVTHRHLVIAASAEEVQSDLQDAASRVGGVR